VIADVYFRSPTAFSEIFGDVTVVLDPRTGSTVRLNAAAGCVWEALATPRDLAAVTDRLASRFAIGATRAQHDALAALDELERHELVTRGPQRAGGPAEPHDPGTPG
jgi:hypothetical protein